MSESPNNKIASPFLRQCFGYLEDVLGAGAMSAFYHRFRERLVVPWFPDFKHGRPIFDIESGTWDFYGDPKQGDLLHIAIGREGRMSIHEGDGSGTFLELTIYNPVEIGEILELHDKISPDNCNRVSFQKVPLSNIIHEIFLLIPQAGENKLVRFDWAAFQKDWKDLWGALFMPIQYFYWDGHNRELEESFLGHYSDWESWVNHSTKDKPLKTDDTLKEDDLLYSPSQGFHPARTVLTERDYRSVWEPRLVFRLHAQQSRAYFLDFVSHTLEAEKLVNDLVVHHLEDLKSFLKSESVAYPSNRLMQIRLATELRMSRLAYEEKIRSLMRQPEPAAEMTGLYIRRIRYAEALHSEYLSEIEAQMQPLPFMIEWPLRRYYRADDRLVKIKCGQQLLNIMCKLPLFLSLEELHTLPKQESLCEPIQAELFGRPASDGTLLKCLREILRSIAEKEVNLTWFGRLLAGFAKDGIERVERIVAARNRFHHPPHDEVEMLAALEKEIPPLIKLLRETMAGLIFVTPDSMSFKDGKRVVVSRLLMGFESDFRREEFVTTASFESFPAGEIVVVNEERSRALPLTHYFKREAIKTVSLDIGLFDRMTRGKPEFVFVRGLGREMP
jgi:hypothetical protein